MEAVKKLKAVPEDATSQALQETDSDTSSIGENQQHSESESETTDDSQMV